MAKYSKDEAPLGVPLPWSTFSLGQEQSSREVLAVSWSQPGLGLFSRQVLAVLNADDSLHLWECYGRPAVKDHWQRIMVVNVVLKRYAEQHFWSNAGKAGNSRKAAESPIDRVGRIKAFCWSPSTDQISSTNPPSRLYSQLIAVADDSETIYLIDVESPHDTLRPRSQDWTCVVKAHVSAAQPSQAKSRMLACLPAGSKLPPSAVEQLSWSSWSTGREGHLSSSLACTIGGRLYLYTVTMNTISGDLHTEPFRFPDHVSQRFDRHIKSPLRWELGSAGSESNHLYCIVGEDLLRVTIPYTEVQSMAIEAWPAGIKVWNQITDLSVRSDNPKETSITISLFGGDLNSSTKTMSIATTGAMTTDHPPWISQMREGLREFDNTHNLHGQVFPRIFGVAASPVGAFSAGCISFHPSDGPEYTISARQQTLVAIAREDSGASGVHGPSQAQIMSESEYPLSYSTDSLLLAVAASKGTKELHSLDPDDAEVKEGRILEFKASQFVDLSIIAAGASIETIVHLLRTKVFYDPIASHQRSTIIQAIASGTMEGVQLPNADVLESLSSAILNLPPSLRGDGSLSETSLKIHKAIHRMIVAQKDGDTVTSAQDLEEPGYESCSVCGEGIRFEALRWSRCKKGHQFSRCNLSYLTIHNPAASKSCGLCKLQYLNEHMMDRWRPPFHVANGAGAKQGAEESLIRALFAACVVCVQCGGRFVGYA